MENRKTHSKFFFGCSIWAVIDAHGIIIQGGQG
jgi:hypothetical protein